MQLIDFDRAFAEHVARWVAENSARFGGNMDRMEMEMPDLYLRWIEEPADFLSGQTPVGYFAGIEDPQTLVDGMVQYLTEGVPLPDLLLERIVEIGAAAEPLLMALLTGEDAPPEAKLHSMDLLRQLQSTLPLSYYLELITQEDPALSEQIELAGEALCAMGEAVVPQLLEVLASAPQGAEGILLDILSNYPGHEAVFQKTLARFVAEADTRALYAGYLAKLGDPRAVPDLTRIAEDPGTHYLDYIEILNAIECLGGDPPIQRDFEGDPFWESLGGMTP